MKEGKTEGFQSQPTRTQKLDRDEEEAKTMILKLRNSNEPIEARLKCHDKVFLAPKI